MLDSLRRLAGVDAVGEEPYDGAPLQRDGLRDVQRLAVHGAVGQQKVGVRRREHPGASGHNFADDLVEVQVAPEDPAVVVALEGLVHRGGHWGQAGHEVVQAIHGVHATVRCHEYLHEVVPGLGVVAEVLLLLLDHQPGVRVRLNGGAQIRQHAHVVVSSSLVGACELSEYYAKL